MGSEGEGEGVAFLSALSLILGWTYFILWSVSYYPQIITNITRRSTKGFTPDFPVSGTLGLLCYTVYCGLFLFNRAARSAYAAAHAGKPPPIALNDFVYSLHGLLCQVVVLSQFVPQLWGWTPPAPKDRQGVSWSMDMTCAGAVAWIAYRGGLAWWGGDEGVLEFTYTLGNAKLFLTLVKYTPQALLNYRRKSTVGFAISAVVMDLVGSLLSLMQLLIDASLLGSWKGVTGNPAKFALGYISLLIDLVFIWQRFVLYRHAEDASVKEDGRGEGDEGGGGEGEEEAVGERTPLIRGA